MAVQVSKILENIDNIRRHSFPGSFAEEIKLTVLDWFEWELICYCKGKENKKISLRKLNKIREKINKEIREVFKDV